MSQPFGSSGGGRSGGRGGRGGRSSGRSGGGRYDGGGRSGGGRHHQGGPGGGQQIMPAKFRPCKAWLQSGICPNAANCKFAHIVQLHATVDASSYVQQSQQTNNYHQQNHATKAAISSIAIWEQQATPPPAPAAPGQPPPPGVIKIFTGSYDGFWRLWNTAANFQKEFESCVGQKVDCLDVKQNFLFCGMQAVGMTVPDVPVGMLHAWNLQQPNVPPLELHLDSKFLPYAHNQAVTALAIRETHVVTGSRDGSIRLWTFNNNTFVLDKSLCGHAREITGLVNVDNKILWSSSTDGCIRIWDITTGACQFLIGKTPVGQPQVPQPPTPGHSNAVTALESFESPGAGTFILSASLDGTIKAWKATTGECVASESHGEGVVSLSIAQYQHGDIPLLLVGLESGNIVCRNLVQTSTTGAFEALFVLTNRFNTAHHGAVKCITSGPHGTFYTGGTDGNMLVWQINGDLGLK